MFTIVLVEPKIPPNTGNIARLCAANDCNLHLVGELGFQLDDTKLKRAGMDYWQHVKWQHFKDVDAYFSEIPDDKLHLLSSKSTKPYTEVSYNTGDYLVFGSETLGLSEGLKDRFDTRCCTIPMYSTNPAIRCLNLSNSVGIVAYEAFRQVTIK